MGIQFTWTALLDDGEIRIGRPSKIEGDEQRGPCEDPAEDVARLLRYDQRAEQRKGQDPGDQKD
jgi:hypothetical protein